MAGSSHLSRSSPAEITLFGAGAWGLALYATLAQQPRPFITWVRSKAALNMLNQAVIRHHAVGDIGQAGNAQATMSLTEAALSPHWFVMITAHGCAELLPELQSCHASPQTITLGCKGLDPQDGSFQLDNYARAFPQSQVSQIGGPGFAKEIVQGLPTALVLAGKDPISTEKVASLLRHAALRIYCSHDVIGVQLGTVMKNPLAIAAGICDGLRLGANARASLLTRGLHEFCALGEAMGADPQSLVGLSGLGDILLSALDDQSRNRQFGLLIAQGYSAEQATAQIIGHIEGIESTRLIHAISEKKKLPMPIIRQLYAILFENLPPREAVFNLMNR